AAQPGGRGVARRRAAGGVVRGAAARRRPARARRDRGRDGRVPARRPAELVRARVPRRHHHPRRRLRMSDRSPDYPIEPLFVARWSPRAFDASPMPEEDLLRVMEAARWAPSAFNVQPWRFLYALRGDPCFDAWLDLLHDFNR